MRIGTRKDRGTGEAYQRTLFAGLAALALFLCTAVSVRAEDSLSCYKGDKDNMVFIGEIVGANFQNAAAECNAFYGDCNGECTGCYLDENSSREVCVDSQGKKFTR